MKKAGSPRPFRCVVWRRSDDRHLGGAEAFGCLFYFVRDHVVFGDVAVARFDVDEDVLASISEVRAPPALAQQSSQGAWRSSSWQIATWMEYSESDPLRLLFLPRSLIG